MKLPEPGTPLELADGTSIQPVEPDTPVGEVRVPTHHEAQELIIETRRKLVDLPEPPEKMNAVALVLAYHVYGLSDGEIGVAVGVNQEQVTAIRMTDAFTQMQDALVTQWGKSQGAGVRQILSQKAITAANKMTSLLESEREGTRMAAAKDILDRAGHRPVDTIEHKHSLEGGLTIEYIQRSELPVIDVMVERE